jgi:cell division protein FtsQ
MAKRPRGATRQSAQSEAPRLRLRWVLLALALPLLLAAAGWAGQVLLDPARFPVSSVRIENRLQRLDPQAVRQAVLPHVSQGFLRIDVDRIRSELEALPWVAEASVRRSWPDALLVRIREQQAAARWSHGGLLNPQGELFRAATEQEQWQQLALLRGPRETEKVLMKEYQAIQGMLTPLGLRISHLTMNERRAWSLNLDNGLQLRLGRHDTHVRLLRFVRVYGNVLQPRLQAIDSIDLRYTNGFAVRWREGAAAAA